MHNDELPELIQRFFTHYLSAQRDLSEHTQRGYRDTFRLLLGFLAKRNNRAVDQLTLESLSPAAVLAFLDFLEKQRANSPRTRNLRLAAVRTFVRFVIGEAVGVRFIGVGHRILVIPQKKFAKPVLGYMTRDEIEAVLAATDASTYSGKRDRLLFTLLYNTGARISEALQLRPEMLPSAPSTFGERGAKIEPCRCGRTSNASWVDGAERTRSNLMS